MRQPAAQTKSPSLPRHQNLDAKTTHTEKVQEIVVSNEISTEDLHASENPNSGKDVSAECETIEKVASKETLTSSSREVKPIDKASDSPATSKDKVLLPSKSKLMS